MGETHSPEITLINEVFDIHGGLLAESEKSGGKGITHRFNLYSWGVWTLQFQVLSVEASLFKKKSLEEQYRKYLVMLWGSQIHTYQMICFYFMQPNIMQPGSYGKE